MFLPRNLLASFLAALFVVGCTRSGPQPSPTQPSRGKLVNKSGQPVSSGLIELVSGDHVPKSARGEVRVDGSFTLSVTDAAGKKIDGAEEGEYNVTYIPRMSDQQSEAPVNLPSKVKIRPGLNELELRLP
jgi:hypothetical protein